MCLGEMAEGKLEYFHTWQPHGTQSPCKTFGPGSKFTTIILPNTVCKVCYELTVLEIPNLALYIYLLLVPQHLAKPIPWVRHHVLFDSDQC